LVQADPASWRFSIAHILGFGCSALHFITRARKGRIDRLAARVLTVPKGQSYDQRTSF
jgi:hypothetical protein